MAVPVLASLLTAVFLQEFIKRFPKTDHPAAFGQHVNADITSLIEETNALLGTMVSKAWHCYLSRFAFVSATSCASTSCRLAVRACPLCAAGQCG